MKIAEIRVKHHLSQIEVAKAIQISQQCYSRYERGEREADYKTLCKLADYFDVTVDELLGRVPGQQLFDDARVPKSEIQNIFDQLPTDYQRQVLGFAKGLLNISQSNNRNIKIDKIG